MLSLSLVLALQAAAAAPSPPPAAPPSALVAELDALLAAKRYGPLGERIARPAGTAETFAFGDWLRDRMIGGASAFVAVMYSRWSWNLGEALPAQRDALRETSAMAALYVYGVAGIDGQRCGDRTAPTHRQEQVLTLTPGLIAFLHNMPAPRKALAIEGATLIERKTAATRDADGDVAFLCTAGMEEMTYNLRHGTTREEPPRPGQIGRQVVVTGDGSYRPSERPEREWRPAMAIARAALPATLAALATPTAR